MKHIFFDFETTGIGEFRKQRAIQLCWIVTDSYLEIEHICSYYIKGNTELNTDFHSHLSLEILEKEGKDLQWVLKQFLNDISTLDGGHLVAHNISFDVRILQNELNHCKIDFNIYDIKDRFFCTMKNSTKLLKIKGTHAGQYKYPKLIELYTHFYEKEPDLQLHDAKNDTIVLLDCYKKLIETIERKNKRKRDDNVKTIHELREIIDSYGGIDYLMKHVSEKLDTPDKKCWNVISSYIHLLEENNCKRSRKCK